MRVTKKTATGARWSAEYPFFSSEHNENVSLANRFSDELLRCVSEYASANHDSRCRLSFAARDEKERTVIVYKLVFSRMRKTFMTKELEVIWKNGYIRGFSVKKT